MVPIMTFVVTEKEVLSTRHLQYSFCLLSRQSIKERRMKKIIAALKRREKSFLPCRDCPHSIRSNYGAAEK